MWRTLPDLPTCVRACVRACRAQVVQAEDPSGHLLSIHNNGYLYNYSRPWVTHFSIQVRTGVRNTTPSLYTTLHHHHGIVKKGVNLTQMAELILVAQKAD